jgi:hypothetical protein
VLVLLVTPHGASTRWYTLMAFKEPFRFHFKTHAPCLFLWFKAMEKDLGVCCVMVIVGGW